MAFADLIFTALFSAAAVGRYGGWTMVLLVPAWVCCAVVVSSSIVD